MKITYVLENEDVINFNIQHLNKLSRIKKIQKKNRILISSLYGIIALTWVIIDPGHWPMSWILAFLGVLWYFFYPKVCQRRMSKKVRKIFKNKEIKSQELEFNHQGIQAKKGNQSGFIPWNAIKKIVQNENYLFLYLNEDDGIIIPRKEIENRISWEKLLDCVKSFFGRDWEIETEVKGS